MTSDAHQTVRTILLKEWDPIGIRDVREAQDEYDSYAGVIYGMLVRGTTKQDLSAYLLAVESDRMGMPGTRERTDQIADMLLEIALPSSSS